jgi:tetratricopeptide (TPR) repeat protein
MLNKVKYHNNALGFTSAAKKIILLGVVLCFNAFVANVLAQKPKSNKPPTAAEMQAIMKEAQKQMQNLDPKTKRMMDSMGIKIPTVTDNQIKNIGKVSDKQIADAFEDNKRIVPKKNAIKIAKANAITLSTSSMSGYLQSIQIAIIAKMNTKQKREAEELLAYVKTQKNTANGIALAASGCMMNNIFYPGLYLMNVACTMDHDNVDLLNNYASFLTMTGGAEFAVPILNNLNQRIPNHPTILNNLGQAWFCLGAIDVAEKNIAACLAINPKQPQANETMSTIYQSKGNTAKAKELLKRSIKTTYSEEKELKLKKLGEKLTKNDVTWVLPKKDDGLGLGRIVLPQWPKSNDEVKSNGKDWIAFFHQVNDVSEKLDKEGKEIEKQLLAENKRMVAEMMKTHKINLNIYNKKASIVLKGYMESYENFLREMSINAKPFYTELYKKIDNYKKQYHAVFEKFEPQYGEGLANPEAEECAEKLKIVNSYLNEINSLNEKFFIELFSKAKIAANDFLYFGQYTANSQLEFETFKLRAKVIALSGLRTVIPYNDEIDILGAMSSSLYDGNCGMVNLISQGCSNKQINEGKAEPINFLEADCKKVELNLYIYSITEQCGRMTGTYHLGPVKLDLEKDANEVGFFTKGSLEISFTDGWDIGDGLKKAGEKGDITEIIGVDPRKLDAGALIEFDRNGITDIGLKAGAKAEAGLDVYEGLDRKVTAVGIEGKITWNTGATISGSGLLDGLTVNYK